MRNWETVNPVALEPLLICCCFCPGLDDIKGQSAHLKKILHHRITLRLLMINVDNVDVSYLLMRRLHISSRSWELGHGFWKIKLPVRLIWEKPFITTALSPKPRKFTQTQCTLERRVWIVTPRLKCPNFCMKKPFLELKQIGFLLQASWIATQHGCWSVGAGGSSGSVSVVSPVQTLQLLNIL